MNQVITSCSFFIDKVTTTGELISDLLLTRLASFHAPVVFDKFESVTLTNLEDVFGHIKPLGR